MWRELSSTNFFIPCYFNPWLSYPQLLNLWSYLLGHSFPLIHFLDVHSPVIQYLFYHPLVIHYSIISWASLPQSSIPPSFGPCYFIPQSFYPHSFIPTKIVHNKFPNFVSWIIHSPIDSFEIEPTNNWKQLFHFIHNDKKWLQLFY